MTRSAIGGGLTAAFAVLTLLTAWVLLRPAPYGPPLAPEAAAPLLEADASDPIFGRVTTRSGTVYEGRMRWGGDEEAFWDEAFNGWRKQNPWAAYVSPEALGQGAGRLLLGHLEDWARARGYRRFHTVSTVTARAFYERQGYRLAGDPVEQACVAVEYPMVKTFS